MPMVSGGHRGRIILSSVAAALAIVGVLMIVTALRAPTHPPGPAPDAARSTAVLGPTATASAGASSPSPKAGSSSVPPQSVGPVLSRSLPKSISIPSIKLATSALVQYGLDANGAIDIPASEPGMPAGWFNGSPTPGQPGPSVIVGHVDSKSGPSVFFHLGQTKPGQTVEVTLASGAVGTFTIDSVETYHKAQFPTLRVYGNTSRAALRLITCGGAFNRSVGHYEDNIVVFAHLTGIKPAA